MAQVQGPSPPVGRAMPLAPHVVPKFMAWLQEDNHPYRALCREDSEARVVVVLDLLREAERLCGGGGSSRSPHGLEHREVLDLWEGNKALLAPVVERDAASLHCWRSLISFLKQQGNESHSGTSSSMVCPNEAGWRPGLDPSCPSPPATGDDANPAPLPPSSTSNNAPSTRLIARRQHATRTDMARPAVAKGSPAPPTHKRTRFQQHAPGQPEAATPAVYPPPNRPGAMALPPPPTAQPTTSPSLSSSSSSSSAQSRPLPSPPTQTAMAKRTTRAPTLQPQPQPQPQPGKRKKMAKKKDAPGALPPMVLQPDASPAPPPPGYIPMAYLPGKGMVYGKAPPSGVGVAPGGFLAPAGGLALRSGELPMLVPAPPFSSRQQEDALLQYQSLAPLLPVPPTEQTKTTARTQQPKRGRKKRDAAVASTDSDSDCEMDTVAHALLSLSSSGAFFHGGAFPPPPAAAVRRPKGAAKSDCAALTLLRASKEEPM